MDAELISVGTEILLGDILNTNARWLGRELASLGVGVRHMVTVGDNEARLLDALDLAFSRCDLVILTGGLGPTPDDLTKETVFKGFGLASVLHEPSAAIIREWFASRNRPMPENNLKQALFPPEALILPNSCGTAPGCVVAAEWPGRGERTAIVLPGPPGEMTAMFDLSVRPWLQSRSARVFRSRTFHFYGIGESDMARTAAELLDQENPTAAPYAKPGECELRLTASAAGSVEALALMEPSFATVRERLGQWLYGEDDDTLASALARTLADKGYTLSLAESCTAGLLAGRLADIPGSSRFLMEGRVTYHNDAKIRLGVPPEIIENHGAVSRECVEAMAESIRKVAGTDLSCAVSGIAGPDGGTPEKPVGLVWFSIASGIPGIAGTTWSRKFKGSRQTIRDRAVQDALDTLRRVAAGLPLLP